MADEKVPNESSEELDDAALAETITKSIDSLNDKIDAVSNELQEAKKSVQPAPFNVRTGEDPLSSRPYSFCRLALALTDRSFSEEAKLEFDLSKRLTSAVMSMGYSPNPRCVVSPLSTNHMHTSTIKGEGNKEYAGYPVDLVKECRDVMSGAHMDNEELLWNLSKRSTPAVVQMVQKDLSAFTDTSGGTLVPLPEQGQLIDLLRNSEVFSRAGAQEITLPPQGQIRFPRDTGDPTIAAYAEGQTITESTPSTSELTLNAKKYSGLVDIPIEILRFSSVNVEAWLRNKFGRAIALQTDSDMIDGTGGTQMKGVITYSGITTVTATTVAANGDTLGPNDPANMIAELENSNARVGSGVFIALRPRTKNRVMHRRADAVSAADAAGAYLFDFVRGTGGNPDMLAGAPLISSTNLPQNRSKGSASNLTIVLAGVGSSWLIGRAGIVEIDMTDSDASKFAQGINTMRATVFMDSGPEHEEEFAFIDTLLENT